MAGRNRMPRQPANFRSFRDEPHLLPRGQGPIPPHPMALEEELEIQHRDMQRILAENRQVVDENVILERELTAVKEEMHRLGQFISKLRADNEAQTREFIDRGLKLEAELRSTEPMRAEVMQLRTEAQKLTALRQELSAKVQTLTKDVKRVQAENEQLVAMKTDKDVMRKELVEARRLVEYKKKANEEIVDQNQAMEKNLISMAREIERLRAEQRSVDRRAQGGVGGYGNSETRYPGSAFSDPYAGGAWGSYDKRGPPRR